RDVTRDLCRLRRCASQGGAAVNRHLEEEFADWLKSRRVGEVECLVPDMGGIARGKILPTNKFLSGMRNGTLRLPVSIFGQMVTGADAETEILTYQSPDMNLLPDIETLRIVPWYKEPTAQVVCDCQHQSGEMVEFTPRAVLRRVMRLYEERDWRPVV